MICSHDEFSVNSGMNRILKTTLDLLLRADISKVRKKQLKKNSGILCRRGAAWCPRNKLERAIQPQQSDLPNVDFNLLSGGQRFASNKRRRLNATDGFFWRAAHVSPVREIYLKEFPQISVSSAQIPWGVDDGIKIMIPLMQSDIMLAYENKILIIDAKYYSHTTQARYNTRTLHSNNLYQIFTYVKNKADGTFALKLNH